MNEEKKHPGGIYLSDLAQQYFPGSTPRSAIQRCSWLTALDSAEHGTDTTLGRTLLQAPAKGTDAAAT